MSEYSIGVDLGGTNLRAAAIDASGRMLEKTAGNTDLKSGREAVIGDMVAGTVPVGSGTWLLHAGHCLERFADRAADISARTVLANNREQVESVGDLNARREPG